MLAGLEGSAPLEEIEDELFRFARILEANPELRRALADGDTPVEYREDLAASLLEGRVNQATLRLIKYSLRAGRTRDLVGTFDWLSERVAAERGRRVARVRAAVALDQDERERLGEALSRRLGVPVEVQVVVDSSLVGGARVLVGDLAVDGTIRRRLDLIRETLTVPELPGLQPLAQTRPSGEDNTKNQGKELR
ncbi:MAG: F0F1 ATP synthase subunit delta [Actinobacteria bacterium]|nr:F0F1 ATP synthase subunit delta [Actinomycetota bacterium]